MQPLQPIYCTPSAASVAALIRSRYDLGEVRSCEFLNRGFNDTFALRTAEGGRYVARLSGRRLRGDPDVASETAFLAWLDAAGVPVAPAVPARDGALFTAASSPEAPRLLVVFRHAEGRRAEYGSVDDARAQGTTLARIHLAAATYPHREEGRHRLDVNHLLHRPVSAIAGLTHQTAATQESVLRPVWRLPLPHWMG